jgi:hypothetical protein
VSGAPAIAALRPVRGSGRLIAVRWALSIAAALPAMLATRATLDQVAGRQPWFTDAPDPLPLPQLVKILGQLGPAVPASVAGVIAAWLATLLVTAAAVEILDPGRAPEPVRLWRSTIDTGTRFLWVYLRISLCAAVLLGLGARGVTSVFEMLANHAKVAGWTAVTIVDVLGVGRVALVLAGAGLVGVLAWWCRVISVGDQRRYVRRLPTMVARVGWLWAAQGVILPWIVGTASLIAGGAVLFAWRQSPGDGTAWFVFWLGLLLAQAYLWHWRLRTLCLIWGSTGLDDVRGTPDEPWHAFRRLRRRWAPGAASGVPRDSMIQPSDEQASTRRV